MRKSSTGEREGEVINRRDSRGGGDINTPWESYCHTYLFQCVWWRRIGPSLCGGLCKQFQRLLFRVSLPVAKEKDRMCLKKRDRHQKSTREEIRGRERRDRKEQGKRSIRSFRPLKSFPFETVFWLFESRLYSCQSCPDCGGFLVFQYYVHWGKREIRERKRERERAMWNE